MSAVAVASNVIPVEFRGAVAAPVISPNPITERLIAEAAAQLASVAQNPDKKASRLRKLATKRGDVFYLNPYLVTVRDSWVTRDMTDPANIAHVDYLAGLIAEEGVQEALTVVLEGNEVIVTHGFMRLMATKRAIEVYGKEINAIPLRQEKYETENHLLADQINRNSGKAHTVLEQGSRFLKMSKMGWSSAQIGKRVNLTPMRVAQIIELTVGSNEGIKELVRSGKVAPTFAAQMLNEAGGDASKAEAALTGAVTVAEKAGKVRATAKHAKAAANGLSEVLPSSKAAIKAMLEAKTTKIVKTNRDGTITLPIGDLNQLLAYFQVKLA